ncbi:transmembrane protein 272-like [Mya arenaria]|uniref:transmembrane protein 272-like n=1 Tax=Mya arenaria TaxID=6604 RepID=UPI0022E430E6|nr:transmembrane protein 272-like [Mya arenaria]
MSFHGMLPRRDVSESKEILCRNTDSEWYEEEPADLKDLFKSTSGKEAPTGSGGLCHQLVTLTDYSTNPFDYLNKAADLVLSNLVAKCLLFCATSVPITMIIVGSSYKDECPQISMLPVFLLVGGFSGLLKIILLFVRRRKCPDYDQFPDTAEDVGGDAVLSRFVKFTDIGLNAFLLVWLFLGSYWYFSAGTPVFTQNLHRPYEWCNEFVFNFCYYFFIFCFVVCSILFILSVVLMVLFCKTAIEYT